MEVRDIPLDRLYPAVWNPNEADEATLRRLANSMGRFGSVLPLVVRPVGDGFEVIGGNQRLKIYREQGVEAVPCVVVDLDDVQARLLAQALNRIHGEDDINRKAALVRQVLAQVPEQDILAILPETAESLRALASLGRQSAGSLAEALSAWEMAKAVRLERISFAFNSEQRETVEAAIARALPQVGDDGPNRRGAALALICEQWLESRTV